MPMCATSNREIVCIPMRLTLSMLQPLGLTHICILRTYVYVDKKPTWSTHTSPFGSRRQPECIYGCHFLSYWALTLFSSFFFFCFGCWADSQENGDQFSNRRFFSCIPEFQPPTCNFLSLPAFLPFSLHKILVRLWLFSKMLLLHGWPKFAAAVAVGHVGAATATATATATAAANLAGIGEAR